MSQTANLLRGIPLFVSLPDDILESLSERATSRYVDAGELLFREGDPGDTLFVIAHGSVDVFAETPEPVMLGTYGRGDSIGEVSLLTGRPRAGSARARRDTQLMCIAREDFDRLLETQPGFATALVHVLGERLVHSRPLNQPAAPLKVISLVPLHDGAPLDDVAEQLSAELRTFGPVIRMQGLDRAFSYVESANQWVLLVAPSADLDDTWTRYCVRQADRVIGVATVPHRGPLACDEKLRGCDLAFRAPVGVEPELTGWLDALSPRTSYVLREGRPDTVARMARRLAGRAVGVVLSGGGARGIAHIGVVEELQRSGILIDRIAGVSMGSTVASLYAEGRPPDEVAAVVEASYVRDTPLRGRTMPIVALSRGEKGLAMQHQIHGQRRIEGLDVPFFCVSSDLAAQRMVVHRRGLVAIAVSASQALPAFVPPLKDGDRMLVDGAIFSNLPVEPMLATGEGPVIAVDVSGRLPPPRAPRSNLQFLRRWIAGPAADWAPSITETVLRSILLGNAASDAAARERADVVIQPNLRGVPTMRFRDVERIRGLGRDAVREAAGSGALEVLKDSGGDTNGAIRRERTARGVAT